MPSSSCGDIVFFVNGKKERIAKSHGSQCGFCTPGIVMSMYALLRNNPLPTQKEMESAFEGNLCRCTGYRPILEGFKTFTKECCGKVLNGCCSELSQDGANDHTSQTAEVNGVDSGRLFKAEEFTPYDPTQDAIFPPELMLPDSGKPKSLYVKGDLVTWIRPTLLDELLELKMRHPKAKLVIGNTEIGIEMKFKNQNYPILIAPTHIPELNAVEKTSDGIRFGASVTLSTIEDVLTEATHAMPVYKTRWFVAILEILKWFAGHQIRNVGAIGGNIMTASPISDLNPILMVARCTLTLASSHGKWDKFFAVLDIKALPKEMPNKLFWKPVKFWLIFWYHLQKRREDDIAIVNTCMRVLLENDLCNSLWKIKDCTFSFGGMAPTTVMAVETIKALIGRTWSEKIVDDAIQLFTKDLPLLPGSPGGQVEYRRSLVSSFFFKFYLNVSLQLSNQMHSHGTDVPKSFLSGASHFQRDITSSTQTFQEVPPDQSLEDVVGRPLPHLAGTKQATGEAAYCDDIPKYAGELYAGIVFSKKAHANILADDVPGQNTTGPVTFDEEIFATEKEHFYLETQASIAVPKGEDGEMELFVSTQNPTLTQLLVARALGVPQNRIVVRTKRMGKVGKPVRCMLDRDEDMTSTGTRHPFLVKYKVGFTVNGKIKALDVSLYSNAGNSLDLSLGVMERAIFHSDNCYLIPNIRVRGYVCKTNIPSNTAFRGFGGPQGMFFTESWMSDVASTCGLSQKQVREINFYHEGDLTHFNQELVSCHIRRIWNELLEKCRYEERKQQVECFNRAFLCKNGGKKQLAGALVHVYRDGSVLVTHGGTEMGQGLHTKMVQIACEQILERLKPYQMENPKGSWEEWLFNTLPHRTPDLAYDWKTNKGRPFNYFCFGAGCSEVEIDCLTGDHQVLRTDIVMDVGPLSLVSILFLTSQVEGAFVQGLGLFTIEELRYSQSGAPWTTGPGAYKIPGFADIPVEFYVHLLRSAPNEKAVYSSKAVGEPPLFLASSVFYAIKDAITSASSPNKEIQV
ncbi:Xanthine dehydrogenase/oxidase [Acropora cervicornis]|uniref:Xanthine dehydrogenase/oxidase n=1 Tax=Acropora cervicornis TaxID=6130 RepID=A0AAD9VBD3_ACRCE|nr:Xanthine dehydrogenase/oxidase [Acropora cervicornis]